MNQDSNNKQQWFEWEREATIHPILICLEAWMKPTKEYCGKGWPESYLFYKGDIIFWCTPLDKTEKYGEYLAKKYVQKENLKKLESDIQDIVKRLNGIFAKLDSIDISKLSDKQVYENYKLVKENFVEWFLPGALVEPIGLYGENKIRKILIEKNVSDKNIEQYVSVLTTTPRRTFSKTELEELLKIAMGEKLDDELEKHAKKYFWIHNNYFTTEVLNKEFFKNELVSLLSTNGKPMDYLEKLENDFKQILEKKKELIKELKLTTDETELIELLEMFAWFQDYRKEYIMKILHYLDLMLGEIGKRRNLTLKQMKYSLASEISSILDGNFDKSILDKRMKNFLALEGIEDEIRFEYHSGEDAIKRWKEVNPKIHRETEVLEITGNPASRGVVEGFAKVTMNVSEAKNLKKGEILITSMTTPDFVTAMKRAAAIVTNEGGILCHAAVVSREFGIPCVVGTKIATKAIRTGDFIEVDGNKGIIRILKR